MKNVFNLPDMLGWHIGNPMGLSPIAMLVIIFVLVEVMQVFNYMIRHRDQPKYYPVLYTLFGLSVVSVFYYSFQAILPEVTEGVPCIGWFCYSSKVGLVWAIIGIICASHVAFGMLIAAMQITAQLSVEAKMIEGKKWKEWKSGLALLLFSLAVSGISYAFNTAVGSWALAVTAVLVTIFCIVKLVIDAKRNGNIWLSFLISFAFFLGAIAASIIIIEVLHACVYIVVFLAAFFAQAKARKKKPAKKV